MREAALFVVLASVATGCVGLRLAPPPPHYPEPTPVAAVEDTSGPADAGPERPEGRV